MMFLMFSLVACGVSDAGEGLQVVEVARGGFVAPTDAVASPDGATFYFLADTDDGLPAVFEVDADGGGSATPLRTDGLTAPTGLVLSCDGATLYVADGTTLHALDVGDGADTPTVIAGPASMYGLAMDPDCASIELSGTDADGVGALFRLPIGSSTATLRQASFTTPTGLHVDDTFVAWLMVGAGASGALLAVDDAGATEVMSGLDLGFFGGVSLVSVGGTAVIPTLDEGGATQLTTVVIDTGDVTQIAAPDVVLPAGVRTAREAPVLVLADEGGDAIFRVE